MNVQLLASETKRERERERRHIEYVLKEIEHFSDSLGNIAYDHFYINL